jgi:hypothetical protein
MREIGLFPIVISLLVPALASSSDDPWLDESSLGAVSRTDHTDGYWCKGDHPCWETDVPGYGNALVGPQHAIGTLAGVSYRWFDADDQLAASVHFITTDVSCTTTDECFKYIETWLNWKPGRLVQSTQAFSERQLDGYRVRHTITAAGDFNVIAVYRPGEFDADALDNLDPQSVLDKWQAELDEREAKARAEREARAAEEEARWQAQIDRARQLTLTQRDFQAIRQGMTIGQVSEVLRRPPDQLSSETGSVQVWLWRQYDAFGMILVTFDNGRVISKSQVGID